MLLHGVDVFLAQIVGIHRLIGDFAQGDDGILVIVTLDRERFPAVSNVLGGSAVGFLAGLVLGVPLAGAAVGAMLGGAGSAIGLAATGIDGDFISEVQGLMKPGTSAVFVLDCAGNMDVILHGIRGLGGTVLKTNVDVERARLIQSTLAAAPSASSPS